ncbi:Hypothetical Protein FCC1311_060142 [Hondaea fermentalgiana]|uniref:Apple domain-containing protein n=1 Tax=Hondaea fermentalgiana TaxID=2315210 RepID=A0A2R5GPJ4_9STRA|nr:Hypothetical Protein FCC1311_060142 [Hondaea fermentalgiana]|eukprot:GBG29794.1 Hypothetical Protein FCC1311_060142 [Hondaea fermentalgiana]
MRLTVVLSIFACARAVTFIEKDSVLCAHEQYESYANVDLTGLTEFSTCHAAGGDEEYTLHLANNVDGLGCRLYDAPSTMWLGSVISDSRRALFYGGGYASEGGGSENSVYSSEDGMSGSSSFDSYTGYSNEEHFYADIYRTDLLPMCRPSHASARDRALATNYLMAHTQKCSSSNSRELFTLAGPMPSSECAEECTTQNMCTAFHIDVSTGACTLFEHCGLETATTDEENNQQIAFHRRTFGAVNTVATPGFRCSDAADIAEVSGWTAAQCASTCKSDGGCKFFQFNPSEGESICSLISLCSELVESTNSADVVYEWLATASPTSAPTAAPTKKPTASPTRWEGLAVRYVGESTAHACLAESYREEVPVDTSGLSSLGKCSDFYSSGFHAVRYQDREQEEPCLFFDAPRDMWLGGVATGDRRQLFGYGGYASDPIDMKGVDDYYSSSEFRLDIVRSDLTPMCRGGEANDQDLYLASAYALEFAHRCAAQGSLLVAEGPMVARACVALCDLNEACAAVNLDVLTGACELFSSCQWEEVSDGLVVTEQISYARQAFDGLNATAHVGKRCSLAASSLHTGHTLVECAELCRDTAGCSYFEHTASGSCALRDLCGGIEASSITGIVSYTVEGRDVTFAPVASTPEPTVSVASTEDDASVDIPVEAVVLGGVGAAGFIAFGIYIFFF